MINDFFFTVKDVPDASTKDLSLYSCELTAKMLKGAKSALDLIKNIEEFNKDKPRAKRISYLITINGAPTPIFVAKAKFVNDNWVVVYGYNKNGSMTPTLSETNKALYIDSISTHMIYVPNIVDVTFGSYVIEDCEFLTKDFTNNGDTMTESQLVNAINGEIAQINSMIGSGEYRNLIKHFNTFIKKHNLATYDFNYNSQCYKQFMILCNKYFDVLKNIVGRHDDPNFNVKDASVPNKMYFFKNESEMEEFVASTDHTRMNVSIQNSFFTDDIKLYKLALAKESE